MMRGTYQALSNIEYEKERKERKARAFDALDEIARNLRAALQKVARGKYTQEEITEAIKKYDDFSF